MRISTAATRNLPPDLGSGNSSTEGSAISSGGNDESSAARAIAPITVTNGFVSVVALPDGYGLLPVTLSLAQVCSWTGLKKTKIQELVNAGVIATSKVDGRTLVLTNSVLALIERNRVKRGI